MRVYNEVYINNEFITELENEIQNLMEQHPEWELDMSMGGCNWQEAEEEEE